MKSEDKQKRQAAPVRRTYKTKEDFLRWLREKGARDKQVVQEEIAQANHAISQALMVWADDGGATVIQPLGKTIEQNLIIWEKNYE